MRPVRIADPDDPRVALYRSVREPELLRDHGVFLAESRLVVQRLLEQSRFATRSVLVTPAAHAALDDLLDAAPCPVFLAERDLFDHLAGFDIHRGCLAIAERGQPVALDELLAGRGPLVILERVGNPDNVGGVFRNAAALGAAGVVLSPGCGDPLYRKAIRTSMGAVLTLPFVTLDDWPGPLEALRSHGWALVALTPAGDVPGIATLAPDLRPRRVALLLGHEGEGLSSEAATLAHARARIPMRTGIDSLNVAAAAAIALYELGRSNLP
ncbi:MAG TPA: RNA methyltransferase [Vicinamibacterales bacterium]|nr:RNA methyltransferase [Vicinamibacterales bacterium]